MGLVQNDDSQIICCDLSYLKHIMGGGAIISWLRVCVCGGGGWGIPSKTSNYQIKLGTK